MCFTFQSSFNDFFLYFTSCLKTRAIPFIQRVHTQSWTGHSETFNKSTTRPTWTSHTLFWRPVHSALNEYVDIPTTQKRTHLQTWESRQPFFLLFAQIIGYPELAEHTIIRKTFCVLMLAFRTMKTVANESNIVTIPPTIHQTCSQPK